MNGPAAAVLETNIAAAGFLCLGQGEATEAHQFPRLSDGTLAKSFRMIGSTGPSLWPAFAASPEFSDGKPDPLDRYTRRTLEALAQKADATVLFPFDGPPYHPFQRWAQMLGGFSQSPLGVLAHECFGPWAAFRAVMLFPFGTGEGDVRPVVSGEGPCRTCEDKPCLTGCPVKAISIEKGYDVPRCRDYLAANAEADCWSGCLARRTCPFGNEHHQDPENARFHMQSFMGF